MTSPEPQYCPRCQTPWVSGNDFCVGGCGWTVWEEGNYHSGPAGYSPNTAYPETQYGSGFDEEANWNR